MGLAKWERVYFKKWEWQALIFVFLILLLLTLFALALPYIYKPHDKLLNYLQENFQMDTLQLEHLESDGASGKSDHFFQTHLSPGPGPQNQDSLFNNAQIRSQPINLNTAGSHQILQLPLPQWLNKRILNFRKAGGQFFSKEDLMKVYGFSQEHWKKAKPFLRFEEPNKSKTNHKPAKTKPASQISRPSPDYTQGQFSPVPINSCSAKDLIALPGIGPTLSKRIIKFRERLGGFHNLEQLKEVFGLRPGLVDSIIPQLCLLKRPTLISINDCTEQKLSQHPYLAPWEAKKLYKFILANIPITEISQILQCQSVPKKKLEKLLPYLQP